MSLATRCTACGTVFRVVRDQLRVSEGWVRCGRCQEVFNALDQLFDLEREAPPPWASSAPSPPQAGLAPLSVAGPLPSGTHRDDGDDDDDGSTHGEEAGEGDTQAYATTQAAITSTLVDGHQVPTESLLDRNSEFADARFPSQWPSGDSALLGHRSSTQPPLVEPVEGDDVTHDAPEAPPGFVQRHDREQRWQHPRARALLVAGALLLSATLMAQVIYHFRDGIVASWPDTRPTLTTLCDVLGCRIEALRRIDGIGVESSGLTRVNGADAYRLSLVLRNRAGVPLALPSVDLSLTDPQGKLVSRRVLTPSDLGATQLVLQPGAEVPLQATMTAGDRRLLGYTIEVFYP
jgi:predicted Zn finger-like uncharacterized protein